MNTPPNPDLEALLAQAESLLGAENARAWLSTPQRGLGGRVPLEVATNPDGVRLVRELLTRIEHGVYT